MKYTTPKIRIWLVLLIPVFFLGLKSDTSAVQEDGITFQHLDFEKAKALAKKEKKMVFIDCYTTWCGPCKLMARTIFKEKAVGDYYNKQFVNIKIDMETSEGLFLGKKYSVRGYPTFLYIKPDGTLVKKVMGATRSSDQFIGYGKAAVSGK